MQIKLVKVRKNVYKLKLVQGVQSFDLAYQATKAECEWYRKQFKIALLHHDLEVFNRTSDLVSV